MRSLPRVFLLTLAALSLLFLGATGTSAGETRDGMLLHISRGSDDPHRVLMALSMAAMLAEDQPVLVYFDITGVEVVLKDAAPLTYSHFTPSDVQLKALLDKGVTIMACPGCLKAAGKTPADLADGIQVADKTKFFSFTEGRIVTLDY